MRIRVALLALLAVTVATVPHAVAQTPSKLFRGETGQGKAVTVRVGAGGKVNRMVVAWTARCRRARLTDVTRITPPPRTRTTEVFRTSGAYRLRQKGGYRITVRLVVRGMRDTAHAAGERWSGTIRGSATVRRRGRPYDRCRLRSTVWSATLPAPSTAPAATPAPPAPSTAPTTTPASPTSSGSGDSRQPTVRTWSFDMTGDAGDYITGGRRWVHGPPTDSMTASGGGAVASFSINTPDGWWSVDFAAPQGQQLTAGTRYANATRYPFQESGAGLSVSGMGRGCNRLTGEFTVHELAYDGRGVMTRFKASFVQHCEGGTAAARGTIEFSS